MKRSPTLFLLLPLPFALLLPLLAILTKAWAVYLLFAWVVTWLSPPLCFSSSLLCARGGGAPLMAFVCPPASFLLGWLLLNLASPGLSLGLSALLSLLGAGIGQEWHKREQGGH